MKLSDLRELGEMSEKIRDFMELPFMHKDHDDGDVLAICRALPLLVEVAAAAKKDREWYKKAHTTCDDHPKPSNCTACALDAALKKLEESP